MKTSRFISLLLCVVMIMSLFTGLAGSASADDVIVHEVQSGEILLKICEKHGLNYYACKNAIMQLNGFTSEAQLAKLSVGQQLKLPASDAVAGSVSTTTSVVTSTTVGATTMTTTTSYVGTTAAGGNIAYYLTAYTVQAGDTLAGICNKLGSNYYYYSPVILGINSLANANYIRPGQVLLIPTTTPGGAGYAVVAHKVQAGETTTSICNRYGVSYQAMRQLVNGLNRRDNMDKIYAGQTVYVPTTNAGAVATTVVSGTTTTTTSGTPAASAGYTISFANGGAFASVNGNDYVTSAPAGTEVSVWSTAKSGYAVKSLDVVRLDTGAPVPVDYNYFTMPNSNVYVDVSYEQGLTISKAKAQGGSFETLVGGFLSGAAFAGDYVTILAYPNQFYSVKSVSYQKTDGTVTSVDVKKDATGNYSFTMPSYPITVSVKFAPTQYHTLSYSGIIGNGKVTFTIDGKEVNQAEQGQTVTLKFTPDKDWAFNTSDFENNLSAHIKNKASLGSFKKIDDTTYTFMVGSMDIDVTGVQFLNRSAYSITSALWRDMNNNANGSIRFNVIDQATGAITYNTNRAKFGDTVQVIYAPDRNYVNDAQYAKDNSKGAGNALLSWSSDNTFTMPDSNVTVNARYVQDGAAHTYSSISRSIVPSNGGTVDFIFDGCVMDTAEVGKVVTVKVTPKPNYDISAAKIQGTTYPDNYVFAVTLNGKLVGEAPASSNFLRPDPKDPYTYTFVKSAGNDTIRVAFCSDYQGVNATFTQITEGGTPVVQGIKGFAINGSTVQGDAQVVCGDTVSFTLDLAEGYEVTQVRKYIQNKESLVEAPNTTAIIPGGTNNSYSYTVTKDDISFAQSIKNASEESVGQLVFEITCRKLPDTYFTVKYTQPKINGETPKFVTGGADVTYKIGATKISDSSTIKTAASEDIAGISGNLVEASDVMINFELKKDDVKITNPATREIMYYTFDKLLLNGQEFTQVESDTTNYLANFILPKDAPDGVVTTEVVYKLYKTEAAKPITLSAFKIDSEDFTSQIKAGIYDYNINVTDQTELKTITVTPDPSSAVYSVVVNDAVPEDLAKVKLVTGLNKVVVKLSSSDTDYSDTTYTFTVNYGMEPSALTKLTVEGVEVNPLVTDPNHPAALTIYEATATTPKSDVELDADNFASATWKLNGALVSGTTIDDTNKKVNVEWQVGMNTLEISVKETGKAPTTYVVKVDCKLEASKLKELIISNYNGGNSFLVDGQYEYNITVTGAPSDFKAVAISGNTEAWLDGENFKPLGSGDATKNGITWKDGVGATTIQVNVTEDSKATSTYLIKVTPDLKPSTMDIYLTADGNMIKFQNLNANYNTTKSSAAFEIKKNDGADRVKVNINGTDCDVTTGDPATVNVGSGEKVEKWNVGNNVVKITVVEAKDSKETTYTLNVNYQATPLKLKTLTRNGVAQGLGNTQSWTVTTAMTADVIAATADIGTVGIRVDGDTAATGNRTIDWSSYSVGMHYIDIEVEGTDYVTGTYHIDVNVKNP